MYENIIPLVTQFLTPDIVAKMASASGISDTSVAQRTVGAAVPAILSGLATLAAKPDGARQLANTVAKQPTNLLDNVASMIGGSGQMASIGKTALSALFGGNTVGALAGAVGRYAGIGEGAAQSLLGLLTPVVLGILGRQAGTGAAGLTELLTSQKDAFAGAIPPRLSDMLKTSGAFERIGTVAAERVSDTVRMPREETGGRSYATTTPTRPMTPAPSANWIYWAIPVLALAGLAWYLLSGERTTQPVAQGPTQAEQTSQGTPVGGELQPQITAAINRLQTALQGVRDPATATQALPNLQQAATELERLSALVGRLPAETRDKLNVAIKTATERLRTTVENVDAMPGMAPDVRPVLAGLRSRLDAMASGSPRLVAERVTYLTRTPSGAILVSTYFDRNILNKAGERIGTINDLILSPDAKVTAAIVSVGGFLGIGEKEVAVPFASFEVTRRDNEWHLVIDAPKDVLMDAPAYVEPSNRVRLGPAPGGNR